MTRTTDFRTRGIRVRQAEEADIQSVYALTGDTIRASYRGIYPDEAIEFFLDYHSIENVKRDAASGYTIIAESDNQAVGTGTLLGTNIRRVFVIPTRQHKGIGALIEQELELRALSEKIATLDLDSSLVSRQFWERLGFVVQREDYIPVAEGRRLTYYRMTKQLGPGAR